VSITADDLPLVQDIDDSMIRDLQEHQKKMFQAVLRATGVAQQRQKGYYDLKVKGPEISKGDFVVYEVKTNLRAGEICSLRLPYKTPLFQVACKLSDMNYEIMPDSEQGPTKIVHYNQLKKVKGPSRVPGMKFPKRKFPQRKPSSSLAGRVGHDNAQNAWAQTPKTQTCHEFHESRYLTLKNLLG
jgi:hypothetical protein